MSRAKQGFTIVEVTLAMSFLSVLLVTVAFLSIHISAVYQKGLSIKAVTSTGRELIDDFSRAISSSPAKSADSLCARYTNSIQRSRCEADRALLFISQTQYADLLVNGESKNVPIGGVFCSGRYSYLWNSGYALNSATYPSGTSATNYVSTFQKADEDPVSNFRLLKVTDADRSLCKAHLSETSYSYAADKNPLAYDVSSTSVGTYEEILPASEDNLALYRLDIFKPIQHQITLHSFYSGTFILATIQGGVDITGNGDYCKDAASLDLNTDFNYCSINKFNFAIRATGENKL